MITKEIVSELPEFSILHYGGAKGIRDEALVESAVARPYQTFGGEDLYLSAYEKTAAVTESIIINHPFVDGNKRTGYLAMLAIVEEGNIEITAPNDATYSFILAFLMVQSNLNK